MNSASVMGNLLKQVRVCIVYAAFFVASFISVSSIHAQQAQPISLDEYREKLVAAAALLDDPDDPVRALDQADTLLSMVRAVRLDSGEVLEPQVPITSFLGQPESVQDDTVQDDDESDDASVADPAFLAASALQRIRLVLDQLERAEGDDMSARLAALDAVFARPAFVQGETLWQRLVNWLQDLVERFFPDSGQGTGVGLPGELIAWTAVIVGGLALAFLLSYWLQGLFGSFVVDATSRQQDGDGNLIPLTAVDARQQANKLAKAGNYREAVRSLYLSSLLSMEESGLIRYDRSLTNREVLGEVLSQVDDAGQTDAVEEHLRPVVDTFDSVWYGVREPDVGTFQSYENEIDGLADVVNRTRTNLSRTNHSHTNQAGRE